MLASDSATLVRERASRLSVEPTLIATGTRCTFGGGDAPCFAKRS
jgi:hypothetical protein